MKSVFNNTQALIYVAILMLPICVFAGDYTKVIEKTFDISPDGKTTLYNKYGEMDIKTWDKNQVSVKVEIVVDASSESRAQKVFDIINIDFDNSSNGVSAATSIEKSSGNHRYKIYYKVMMPATNQLDATMKYGTLHVDKILAKSQIQVKYGNFQIQEIGDNSRVYLAYSNGTCKLEKAQDLDLEISYAKIHIYEAKDVTIEGKYSKGIVIDKAEKITGEIKYSDLSVPQLEELRMESGYSNFKLGKLNNLHLDVKYTSVKVEEVAKVLDVNMGYNGITVERLDSDFDYVNFDGKYAKVNMGISAGTAFQFDMEGRYSNVSMPDNVEFSRKIRDHNDLEMEGYKGSANAKGKIKMNLGYGNVRIYERGI